MWQLNTPTSFGLMRTAEEGNVGPLSSAVVVSNLGKQFGSAVSQISILPGQTRSVTVTADTDRFPLFSAVWMLVMTNDGFSGIDSLDLREITGPRTLDLVGYDAGTERNNERNPFLIARQGTNRDPEGGIVRRHQGIRGDADAPAEWKFDPTLPVARVTITPVQ